MVRNLRDRGAEHTAEGGVPAAEVDAGHPALLVGVGAERVHARSPADPMEGLDAVTGGPHAGHRCALVVVDDDAAPVAHGDAGGDGQGGCRADPQPRTTTSAGSDPPAVSTAVTRPPSVAKPVTAVSRCRSTPASRSASSTSCGHVGRSRVAAMRLAQQFDHGRPAARGRAAPRPPRCRCSPRPPPRLGGRPAPIELVQRQRVVDGAELQHARRRRCRAAGAGAPSPPWRSAGRRRAGRTRGPRPGPARSPVAPSVSMAVTSWRMRTSMPRSRNSAGVRATRWSGEVTVPSTR